MPRRATVGAQPQDLRGASALSQTRSHTETWLSCEANCPFLGQTPNVSGRTPPSCSLCSPAPSTAQAGVQATRGLLSLTPPGSLTTPIRRPGRCPVGAWAAELLPVAGRRGWHGGRRGPRRVPVPGVRAEGLARGALAARTPACQRYPRDLFDCEPPRGRDGVPQTR